MGKRATALVDGFDADGLELLPEAKVKPLATVTAFPINHLRASPVDAEVPAAAVESQAGRDAFGYFCSELSRHQLLTREGEVACSIRIVAGRLAMLEALAVFPPIYDIVDGWRKSVTGGELPWRYRNVADPASGPGFDEFAEPSEDDVIVSDVKQSEQLEVIRQETLAVFDRVLVHANSDFSSGVGALPEATSSFKAMLLTDERLHELTARLDESSRILSDIDREAAKAARLCGLDIESFAAEWKAYDPSAGSGGKSVGWRFDNYPELQDVAAALAAFKQQIRMPVPQFRRASGLARKGSDEIRKAKSEMVNSNLRLVISIARKWGSRGIPMADLVQEGNIGLLRAVDKFEYSFGYKFSTYATWWIRQGVTRSLVDQGHTIRVPVHMAETLVKIRRRQMEFRRKFGRSATDVELAESLRMDLERVRTALEVVSDPISLDMQIGEDDDFTLGSLIADVNAPDPAAGVMLGETRSLLSDAMKCLNAREERILRMRFGFGLPEPCTLEEVGCALGVTRERIRQIESKAMRKLRHTSRTRLLRPLL